LNTCDQLLGQFATILECEITGNLETFLDDLWQRKKNRMRKVISLNFKNCSSFCRCRNKLLNRVMSRCIKREKVEKLYESIFLLMFLLIFHFFKRFSNPLREHELFQVIFLRINNKYPISNAFSWTTALRSLTQRKLTHNITLKNNLQPLATSFFCFLQQF
jgi:hypothetical protein